MDKIEKKLTSVHIIDDKYKDFKVNSIKSNINLQKFVNRCIDLYNKNPEFRNKVNSYDELAVSGSKF